MQNSNSTVNESVEVRHHNDKHLLPAVFSSLEQYVIERKDKYFVLKIPIRIQIDFDRDLILSLFDDVIVHYKAGDTFQTIEVFEK
jgi:hypothetical protein